MTKLEAHLVPDGTREAYEIDIVSELFRCMRLTKSNNATNLDLEIVLGKLFQMNNLFERKLKR